jgi:hypothetical protein
MLDEQNDQDTRDLGLMSGVEPYEVRFFAERNGMSLERARELIEQRGRTRAELEAELAR